MINQDMKVRVDNQFLKTYLFAELKDESPERAFLYLRQSCKVSVGSFLSSLVPAHLYLTLDHHLVVNTVEDGKIYANENLEHFKKDLKIKDLIIVLTYVKKGLIFDSNKEIRLHFDKPEDLEHFKLVFIKLMETQLK